MGDLDVALPVGGRLVVAHLPTEGNTAGSDASVAELIEMLDAWDGVGVFVIVGGAIDNARLKAAVDAFGKAEGRSVVVVEHGLDVIVTTGAGEHRVRVERDATEPRIRELLSAAYDGVITSSETPSFENRGTTFVAMTGRVGEGRDRRGAHLILPDVVVPTRVASWVEIEAGADLHARLWFAQVDLPGASVWARVVGRHGQQPDRPTRVAVFPGEESWPEAEAAMERPNRVRRRAAALIALAGALDLLSAITPPLEQRLRGLLDLVPLAVPQVATALVTAAGLALLALARGVRRGQTRAYRVAVALLVGSVVLHIIKGIDLEEGATAAIVAVYLLAHRDAFRTKALPRAIRHGIRAALGGLAAVIVTVTAAIEIVTEAMHHRITIPRALLATVERLVGLHSVALPDRLDDFASPMLITVAVAFVFWLAWQAIRPAAARRGTRDELRHARTIVDRYGGGTLDYFALRNDKQFFFYGETLVAYAVHQSVCLVSPDPIGPEWEREDAWDAFRAYADGEGWSVGGLGAGEDWLPIYRRSGMHDLYVGDEAVVDVTRFSLDGGRNKGLRQARNRIANHGYTMSFHDPLTLDPATRASVEAVMGLSRRGDVERGFSMTLGRIFDGDDRGLLLAVCHDPEGTPVAFCQYVPAPGINGYSLDLMRRDQGEHPNGLLEFVLIETILHLAAHGYRKLGLNFATMRAILAGESGAGITARVERWALLRMGGSMQIESLWKFNAKFDPEWQPRYALYDAVGNMVPIAFAIARAESWWELPVIGRFLVPPAATPEPAGRS